ncbi:flagellar motor protein PomA [Marinomonas mediterranea]|uniref:MotA/TolQ/ExbB proton channel n=1 Tax=Marinomonas mediterranea (strain ATCC 700492 / JCM 21426 / NBRC 103028 / MMB-1) TaxID=717774 RepID=F2K4I0_MARM1|nr:flagellar motor protein PomA [Marinomonas mediterranea]ADZ90279.1 MotA/TolQ/ExbB proton channel [Marinomonas mediterranea MMB-1]WCN08339.1 flagellar motor protein PomA [Marinomonas mediterranea]WCN12396.1 flagellar motor protein PomA [Marinomonas mediterranea]WCN16469.1 flagellar motor protein PomA [Marinomonas mediterranea MMB-1]
MDLATLVGLIGSFVIILLAILLGGSAGMFVDPASILIVLIGSTFVTLMQYPLGQFLGAGKVAAKAFMFKSVPLDALIDEVYGLADEARKGGLLSLEGKEVSHPFMSKGIQMLVDGHDGSVVKGQLSKDMNMAFTRHDNGAKIFKALGDVGPAMGMIGTLVGLVQMLANMDDPKAIGPAMAVALLTTLYGAMLANMVCLPIQAKLENRAKEELMCQQLILDALLAIQAGQNPRVLDGSLKTFIPESKRTERE